MELTKAARFGGEISPALLSPLKECLFIMVAKSSLLGKKMTSSLEMLGRGEWGNNGQEKILFFLPHERVGEGLTL